MPEDTLRELEDVRKEWDERSTSYDAYFNTFGGKLDEYLRWKLIKESLPEDKTARILDAGGGTGMVALPLAGMSYAVTLCDLSPGQLRVTEEKLRKHELSEEVEIIEADIANLPFPDEFFDLVLAVRGPISLATDPLQAVVELSRVTKRGGRICVDVSSRYWAVIQECGRDPETALKLIRSELDHACGAHGLGRVFSPEELEETFERNGIEVTGIHGDFAYYLPEEIRKATKWGERLYNQVTEILERLSRESSVTGMGNDLILVGAKY
ncbi:MAG: Ubiquinone/menaquinone biosynthesis C-methyltransferase UbiE [Candidatus Methanogasteraceae archaeon]|nr:MAG: Ubiquinone/menaquinone biosynthesis C-methyltransferase UbiE [ANME-2 cluster archaeon]